MSRDDDMRTFYSLSYAKCALDSVIPACDYVLKEGLDPKSAVYNCLVAGICVLYGQAFKRSRGALPVSEEIVPERFLPLHKRIMAFRDKVVAHRDATIFRDSTGHILFPNQIVLHRRREGIVWTKVILFLEPDMLGLSSELFLALDGKLSYWRDKYEKRLRPFVKCLKPGNYWLDTSNDPPRFALLPEDYPVKPPPGTRPTPI